MPVYHMLYFHYFTVTLELGGIINSISQMRTLWVESEGDLPVITKLVSGTTGNQNQV